jgi:DNA-binding NarL/FixJ family response regulator
MRQGLAALLETRGVTIKAIYDSEPELEEALADFHDDGDCPWQTITLILDTKVFGTIHRIREVLKDLPWDVPLVVISQHVSRGEVYAALRIGAKAYVDLDCQADELAKAIRLAATGKVHLAPGVAELLVNDMSAALDTDYAQRPASNELSRREVEIVQLLCEGLSSKQIARRLHLSAKTIENHRYNIYRKCDVDSIAGLMRHAIQHGMVSI